MFKRSLITLQAMESVSHGDTSNLNDGTNTRLFMRHGLLVDGVAISVPDVSENSLRSVMFRQPLHDHLLKTLGMEAGGLPQAVVNMLYSGGNLAKGAKSPGNDIALGHEIRRLYPSLELLGGATDAFVLPKSRLKLAAWPVCREFARIIAHVSPEHEEEAREVSVFDLLFEETRTRGTGSRSSGNQTLYQYEVIASGARFLVEITLDAWTPDAVESAVAVALSQWDGYFGGQGRQGRGRMEIVGKRPGGEALTPYLEHLEEHSEKMRAGLLDGSLGTGKPVCVLQ